MYVLGEYLITPLLFYLLTIFLLVYLFFFPQIFSEKLVRVGFLKHRHAERLRAKREWPLMEAEDRLGFLMRADYLRAEGARRSAIERSMDDDNDSDEGGFDEAFDFEAGDGFSKEM